MWFKAFMGGQAFISIALVGSLTMGTLGFGTTIAKTLSNQGEAPAYPRNENGQTYGSALYATSPETEPDLILAKGEDGTIGYVRSVDLNGVMPKSPQEALELQSKVKSARKINLYAVDGETIIGTFIIDKGIVEMEISDDQISD